MEATHLRAARFAPDLTRAAPGLRDGFELRVCRESKHVVALQTTQQIQHFRRAVVAVAANEDAHLRPMPADAVDDVPEHARDLFSRWTLAGPEQRQDWFARGRLEDVDRLEAMPARMRVEQGELLATVHEIIGVVDIQLDGVGRGRVAAAEQVDEADADLVERPDAGEVLEPRDRRLARNIVTVLGRTIAGDHQRGIVTQRIEIAGVLVAGGNGHHARRRHGGIGVDDEQRVARVGQRPRDDIRHAEPDCRLAQYDQAAVRREVASILLGCERLGPDG